MRGVPLLSLACLALLSATAFTSALRAQDAARPLPTRWATDLNPERPLQDYPRPQMTRPAWVNLNGRWQWSPAKADEPPPCGKELSGRIVVPFPIESALSGVAEQHERLWYRRTFSAPKLADGGRLLLHFGAVDWEATVYVNGTNVGAHRGGYDGFSFDITAALVAPGPQELIVGVFDPSDAGEQARGKQVRKPEGIWYTPCTGIWQTVWLEPVPAAYIESLTIRPDVDGRQVLVTATVAGESAGLTLDFQALDDDVKGAGATQTPGREIALAPPRRDLWSPESPVLFDLNVELRRGAAVVDKVRSYFAMRKIEVKPDEKGVARIFLNNQPYFQIGPLDQGYWPDGIYTAPTDAALRSDIEAIKRLGFNMVRKHVKVEPQRWYYWADRLGVLVWQDMPSGAPFIGGQDADLQRNPETAAQFERELRALIAGRGNHPSIVMWVVFNEGWGQYDTPRMAEWVKRLDPTRLVNSASGWTDRGVGDVIDIHNYPAPAAPKPEPKRAAVLGEFGGLGLPVAGHMWREAHWGYQAMSDGERLTRKYEQFLRRVYALRDHDGLSAAVYTQLTDVEIEANGLLTYDRAVTKVDVERVAAVNRGDFSRIPPPPVLKAIAATSEAAPQFWRFTLESPVDSWTKTAFDDSGWSAGNGGFGTSGTPGAVIGTEWKSGEIWLRRTFEYDGEPLSAPHLRVHHDEDCEVFLNGVRALKLGGYSTEYEEHGLAPEALRGLQRGANVLAVRCRQTRGGQFIDVGLVDLRPGPTK